jgi:hypothetical protein
MTRITPLLALSLLLEALMVLPAAAEEPAVPEIEREYVLQLLIDGSPGGIDGEIRRLAGVPAARRPEPAEPRRAFVLGILYQHRYLQSRDEADARHSLALLEKSAETLGDTIWHRLHLGMAYGSMAEIKRMFGAGEMKAMHRTFEALPSQPSLWLVNYLAGTTLTEFGLALPDIIFVAGDKRRALAAGRSRLRAVLEWAEGSGREVPQEIRQSCRSLLARSR